MSDLARHLTPEALAAPDWSDRVLAEMPVTLDSFADGDDDLDEDDVDGDDFDENPQRRLLADLCQGVLAKPAAIAHPDWGKLVRALVALCCDYRELTDDAYGEALDPDHADEDEGGVVEMIMDMELSTIGDALELLAHPDAVARDDWEELVRHVLDEKERRLGRSLFLSCGCEEADQLFEAAHVRAHPAAAELWQHARRILPLSSQAP